MIQRGFDGRRGYPGDEGEQGPTGSKGADGRRGLVGITVSFKVQGEADSSQLYFTDEFIINPKLKLRLSEF